MSTVTIIGTGNMARGIAARALAAGRTVELLNRDAGKAAAVAAELGGNTTSGAVGQVPSGDIVVLAVPFDAAKEIVTAYGEALAGKTIVDITNPVNFETFDSLVVAPDTSAAEEIAALTPGNVVKAFNTNFAGTLVAGEAGGHKLDGFIAGDNTDATAAVASLMFDGGMRPLVVGALKRSRELEGFQFLLMTLQANPEFETFNWNTGLKVLV
ncbi:putative dinucleotide-binding enzyme [Arthrobacter stackebrandtii]|uniref:Dinucleotide-binding enzyme n=1 Tax=Arthrobacter stackebrandtii TaxID=272161 RepID=A0ABS4YV10_9MICC|nr:NAD(P)-binding domain-containing protein [Arthrobacter stackebrandtii]MBP2412559.1 putative dinucleotide-binding enzyme [Arthrobacter stackebrandtii]PYH02305.1 NADP oxidoreductase [Arthrobacter stackebrandtii]